MRTYHVTTPAAGYTGEIGGVHFINGKAVVEAPEPLGPLPYSDEGQLTRRELAEREEIGQHAGYRAMAYFRAQGYHIEDVTADEPAEEPETQEDTGDGPPPAKNATTEEWRTYMVNTGRLSADEAGQLGRDQLVERFEKGASA